MGGRARDVISCRQSCPDNELSGPPATRIEPEAYRIHHMSQEWPNRERREKWEITNTLEYLSHHPGFNSLSVQIKSERPDYVVLNGGRKIGVELTSVYLSDKSVPDCHMEGNLSMFGPSQFKRNKYFLRVIKTIKEKVGKAREGYTLYENMILSVYINEYEDIFNSKEDWQEWAKANDQVLDDISPFTHILLWPLVNDISMMITPNKARLI